MAKIAAGVATIAGAAAMMVVNPAAGSILASKVGGITLAHMIGQAGLSIGSSLTLGGVAEEMRGGPGYSGSLRQPAASRQVIYGQCRVSGVVIYTNTTGHQLNQVIAWASHAVKSIDAIYLDGRQIIGISNGTGDADGNTHYDVNGVKYKFSHSGVHCESSDGTAAGKWLSSLNAQNSAYWGADCVLCGICATYIKTTYSDSEFSGPPNVKATIHGKCDIWDPRLGDRLNPDGSINAASHVWTDNWALCVADVLVNADYGVGCTWEEIDVDQLIGAANICDESVPLANGGSEKRYTVNGSFDFSAAPGDTLSSMLMAAEGRVTYTGGKFKIYPAAWYGTNLVFDHNDVIGDIKWSQRKRRDLCNAVRATYVCPVYPYSVVGYDHDHPCSSIFDGQWQPTDAPEYAQDTEHGYDSDAFLAADGCRLYADRRYQFVSSCATVQRLMKIYLLRNRQKGSGSFKMSLAAYQTQAQDVVQMTLPELGWTSKYLEVQNFRFVPNMGDESTAPFLSCELDVAETNPAVYSWSTAEERGVEDAPSPTIANFQDVDAPTGLTLTSNNNTALVGVDGVTTPRILVSWDAITDPFVESGGKIQLQYQLSGTSAWTSGGEVSAELQYAYIGGVVSGKLYNARIRAVRGNGAASDWAEIDGHTVATVRSVLSAADVFLTDTQSLQDAIGNISSDNVLASGEKSAIITDVANIQNEQSGIDALADFYGITTEKTAYDSAVSALNAYLAKLSSPVAWNDTTGSTTVDGTTFRSKFEAVYSARTALANKCNSTAKSLADTAKSTADTAKTTADNAQSTANNAQDTANTACSAASQAKSTADSASTAVASLATEAMKKADFLDANGKIPANTKVSEGSITSPLIAGNAVLAKNLTVANFDNLIPNPNSNQVAPTGGWPSGAYETEGLYNLSGYGYCRRETCGDYMRYLSGKIAVRSGDTFFIQADCMGDASNAGALCVEIQGINGTGTSWPEIGRPSGTSWTTIKGTITVPSGCYFIQPYLIGYNLASGQSAYFNNFYMRRMADANLIVDGGITTDKLAVRAVTAEKISFTAGDVKYTDGSTIDSMKPAQAGATVGATLGSNLKKADNNIAADYEVLNSQIGGSNMITAGHGGSDTFSATPGSYGAGIQQLRGAGIDRYGFQPGEYLTVSADLWQDAASLAANQYASLFLYPARADGTWMDSAALGSAATSPERRICTFRLPTNVDDMCYIAIGLWHGGGTGTPTVGSVYCRNLQVERGRVATTFKPGKAPGADITGENTAADVQTGDGKAVRQRGADVTANNTAAGIANQGLLATKSAITSTELTAGCVQTPHLDTNGLDVGGGGGKCGFLRVFNEAGELIGYIGGIPAGDYGIWSQTAAIGGTLDNPKLCATKNGDLIFNGGTIKGVNGIAVDAGGNLQFKNKKRVVGSTYSPSTSSSRYGKNAVPEMSITMDVANASNGVLIMFHGSLGVTSNDASIELEIRRDNSKIGPSFWTWCRNNGSCGLTAIFYDAADTGLTAGSHTYQLYACSYVGDSSSTAHWDTTNRSMTIVELG